MESFFNSCLILIVTKLNLVSDYYDVFLTVKGIVSNWICACRLYVWQLYNYLYVENPRLGL